MSYFQGKKFTCNDTLRDRLIWKWYPCPGCDLHNVSKQKRTLLFNRFHARPHKAWLIYWRSHPTEFKALLDAVKPKCQVLKV